MKRILQTVILSIVLTVTKANAQEWPGLPIPDDMPEWLIYKDGINYLVYHGDTLRLHDNWYWVTYKAKNRDQRKYNVQEALSEPGRREKLHKFNCLGMPYIYYDHRYQLDLRKIPLEFAYELFFERKTYNYIRVLIQY